MTEQRLPHVNSDDGAWGDILRQFLAKEHVNTDVDYAGNGGHQHLTITAGTATAGTAPIAFTAGVNLTTPLGGEMEYDGSYFYLTTKPSSTAYRRRIAAFDETGGATGDIYYRDSNGYLTRVPIGASNGYVLNVASGVPAWTNTLSNLTHDNSNTYTAKDANFTLQNSTSTTKQANFDLSSVIAGHTTTLAIPEVNGTTTIVGTDTTQTLTHKTLDGGSSGSNTFTNIPQSAIPSLAGVLNGYITSDTGASNYGQYTALATITLAQQWSTAHLVLWMGYMDNFPGGMAKADVYVRLNNVPGGGDPQCQVYIYDAYGYFATYYDDSVTAVVTTNNSTNVVVTLYGKIFLQYVSWSIVPLVSSTLGTGSSVQILGNQGFISSLPAGTSFAGTYMTVMSPNGNFDTIANAVGTGAPNFPYGLTSNSINVADVSSSQTLTNKTLTGPKIDVIKDGGGANALSIGTTASAVNYIGITNQTTGNAPGINAFSTTDTNVDFLIAPKGNGATGIYASTGNTPTLKATGVDTNIDLNLKSQGAGVVKANGVQVVDISSSQTLTHKTIDTASSNTIKINGNTLSATAGSATVTIPNTTDTLAAYTRDVAPLYTKGSNLVLDGGFENNAVWANAFGVMSTAKAYSGKQSRLITASGAGTTTDRLTLTHDNVGNPISVEIPTWGSVLQAIRIMRGASNTGNTSNLYLRLHYKDTSGVEQTAATTTIAESALSSSTWSGFEGNWYVNGTTQGTMFYVTVEIDPGVSVGNQFYIDGALVVDSGLLSGYQGTANPSLANMAINNSAIDNTNAIVIKDAFFTLQNNSDTSKQAKFDLSGVVASTTPTLTVPGATTTLAGLAITQTWTAAQSFNSGNLKLNGLTSGTITLNAAGTAGSNTLTLPAATDTLVGQATADNLTNKTLTSPIFNGTVTGSGVGTTPAASTLAQWDSNSNLQAEIFIPVTASTVTSSTPVALTINDKQVQVFTGSTAQTVKLPTTSVVAGQSFTVINQSSADITVQSSAGNTLNIIKGNASVGGGAVVYVAKQATPTSDLHWYSTSLQGARTNTITSSATPAINVNNTDVFTITALAANITSMTSGLTGTPVDGQTLMIRMKGAASQTITWGASFGASGTVALPTSTVAGKTHNFGFVYDTVAALWVMLASDPVGY